jgi:hypothetical protein
MKNFIFILWLIGTVLLCITVIPMVVMYVINIDYQWFKIGKRLLKQLKK